MPATDLKELASELKVQIDTKEAEAAADWKAFADMRASAVEEGVDFTKNEEAFEKLDVAGKAYDAKRDEINGLKNKWARLVEMGAQDGVTINPLDGKSGPTPVSIISPDMVTMGKSFVESDEYQALLKSGRLGLPATQKFGDFDAVKVLDRDALLKTLVTGGSDTSGGAFVINDRQTALVDLARRTPIVAQLVNSGTTNSDTVEYVQMTARTNNAAETPEATATWDGSGMAPESALALAIVTTQVRDITTFIPATKKIMADAGQVATLINGEVGANVIERLDGQMINGDGLGENLKGIMNTAGILTRALGGDTRSDAVHKAITALRIQFFEPTTIGLYPTDLEDIVLEKATTGEYIYGPPSQPGPRTIWGLTPIASPVFTNGTPLVGDYARGATLWLREGLSVAASDSVDDFFLRRMVAVLGVIRAAFGVQRPTAFHTITGF